MLEPLSHQAWMLNHVLIKAPPRVQSRQETSGTIMSLFISFGLVSLQKSIWDFPFFLCKPHLYSMTIFLFFTHKWRAIAVNTSSAVQHNDLLFCIHLFYFCSIRRHMLFVHSCVPIMQPFCPALNWRTSFHLSRLTFLASPLHSPCSSCSHFSSASLHLCWYFLFSLAAARWWREWSHLSSRSETNPTHRQTEGDAA